MSDSIKVRYGTEQEGPFEVELLTREAAEAFAKAVGGVVVDDTEDDRVDIVEANDFEKRDVDPRDEFRGYDANAANAGPAPAVDPSAAGPFAPPTDPFREDRPSRDIPDAAV